MQSKGFIRFIAIFLVIVCIYQLLFTWKAAQIERRANNLAETAIVAGDPAQLFPNDPYRQLLYNDSINQVRKDFRSRYLDSMNNEVVLNLLFAKFKYKDCKERQLNLGLDLQGGMSTVLQVSLKELIIAMSDESKDKFFLEALDLAEKRQATSTQDYITLFADAFNEVNPNGRLAPIFSTRNYQDRISFQSSNLDVIALIREEAAGAIDRTYNIISSRIDQFGVKQPNVTLEPARGRINVELAGVDNPERVRKLLQATASLEFWETYKASEIGGFINEANDALKLHLENEKSFGKGESDLLPKPLDVPAATPLLDALEGTPKEGELLTPGKADTASEDEQMEQFRSENPLFTVLQPAIDQQSRYLESPIIGYARTLDTAMVNRYLNIFDVRSVFPREVDFFWSAKPINDEGTFFALYAIKKMINDDKPPLDGGAVVQAKQDISQMGRVVVTMRMNPEGTQIWKKLTGDNIGNHIAIVLDKQVYSAPVVNSQIDGGNSEIEGNFTIPEAQDLANILKAGKLPAAARIVEEELVGPSLGKESIRAGITSIVAGFVLVIAFMILYYTSAGVVANLALLFNLFLIIGILASLGATLTLPGIAGIVLTLGMAVDANVIIFERIREELRAGRPLKLAIPEGFKNSLSAIIDGNLTTLITAIILAVFGMGPVLGFATTLIIGIATTLFTAVLVTRMMVDTWMEKNRKLNFESNLTKNLLIGKNFDFLGKRKYAYAFSIFITVIGLSSIFIKGFDFGVDFKGGREYKVRFEQPVSTVEIKGALDAIYGSSTVVKSFGASNQIKVTTSHMINVSSEQADQEVDSLLFAGLAPFLSENTDLEKFREANIIGSTKIEPTISADIKKSSLIATVVALIAIFFYILIRFRNLGYSIGALVATIHDALFVTSIFSILNGIVPFALEIDQIFIASILTIIGYSLNDTVVVFDRLREYLGHITKADKYQQINSAINSTLSRTVMTAFTTMLVVLTLFFFGGEILRGFSFSMIMGMMIGVYSSVFIAAPIMYDFSERFKKTEPVAEANKPAARPVKKK
jgi:SecD/SecF fusion protein